MNTNTIQMFDATIKYSQEEIFVQPVCEFFAIDYLNQRKYINKHEFIKTCVSKKTSMFIFQDERERLCLTKEGFVAWILQLRCQIVHPNLRENLGLYQKFIIQYLFGSYEREKNVVMQYYRYKKIKRLIKVLTSELKICQNGIDDYLSGKCRQTKLEFIQNYLLNI